MTSHLPPPRVQRCPRRACPLLIHGMLQLLLAGLVLTWAVALARVVWEWRAAPARETTAR